jgi:predicted AlkP superfamily phosphohydrolase/phosphomutase
MDERKILIIGLDGGTWDILHSAMDFGYMPFLKSLLNDGISGVLKSTMPPITPAAWGSFQTGLNPGKHGVFDFGVWDKRTKKLRIISSNYLPKTIWEILSENDKRVGVINVPMTYPPRKVNGCMVSDGLLTPSLESDFTYPKSLKKELLNEVKNYSFFKLENIIKEFQAYNNLEEFVDSMASITKMRAKAAKYLLSKYKFDLFVVHFQAVDVIQHPLWGYMKENHPLFDKKKRDYIFSHFYKELDNSLMEIREVFKENQGDKFITLIISDHGFQTHKKRFNLANWLYKEGLLKINEKAFKKPLLISLIQKIDVLNIRGKLSPEIKNKVAEYLIKPESINERFIWSETKAFSSGRSTWGFIYILDNDKNGLKETEKLIKKKLSEVRDPDSGTPIVKNIYNREELYKGNRLEAIPDIIVEPNDGYSFTGSYIPDEGLFHNVNPKDDFHIGMHHRDGIIIAQGEDIITGRALINAQITDIAPTILYYLGIPIPRNIDGKVQNIFKI